MKRALAFLIGVLFSVFSGVAFIRAPNKPFMPDTYDTSTRNEINWRDEYLKRNNEEEISKTACEKAVFLVEKKRKAIYLKNSTIAWIWKMEPNEVAKTSSGITVLSSKFTGKKVNRVLASEKKKNTGNGQGCAFFYSTVEDKYTKDFDIDKKGNYNFLGVDEDNWYYFKVPKGTYITAPANCYLVPESAKTESLYPFDNADGATYTIKGDKQASFKGTIGCGITIQWEEDRISEEEGESLMYQIEFGSLERWWCCLQKTDPDILCKNPKEKEDKERPRYTHSVSFSRNDTFAMNQVLGKAGLSGMPDTVRKKFQKDSAIVMVRFSLNLNREGFRNVSLTEFYKETDPTNQIQK